MCHSTSAFSFWNSTSLNHSLSGFITSGGDTNFTLTCKGYEDITNKTYVSPNQTALT